MSQKTDSMIKLALVFFVSLLSFSIGTYVGKKYSDNQHKLALLEKPAAPATAANPEFAADGTDHTDAVAEMGGTTADILHEAQKPAALTDSEVAQLAEEFAEEDETEVPTIPEESVATIKANEKTVGTLTDTQPNIKNAEVPTLSPSPDQASVGTPNAKSTAKPAPTAKAVAEERIPASIPAKSAKSEIKPMHFTVQIGSYPTEGEAAEMTKSLQNKGYKTSYVPATVNGQVWYRVSVGLFGTIKEAQDYKKEFLEKTKISSAIIQRVQ